MPIDCGRVIITDDLIKQVEQHKKEQNMSVKDFKEEIIKKNLSVIRWDSVIRDSDELYKIKFSNGKCDTFAISHGLSTEKHVLEEFLNKNHTEYKAKSKHQNPSLPKYTPPPPPQKDAPFYQGMTKEETIESICKDVYASPKKVMKIDVYRFGHVVVSVSKWKHGYQLELIRNEESNKWQVIGKATPYYKELIQLESPAKNKEQEEKAVFEEHQHQKHLMEQEAQRKKEEAEMKAKAQFKEPQLTPQDLIQAAKDELVDRTADLYVTCSIDPEKQPTINVGFAECIKFLEQTIGKDPYKN